MLQPGDLILIKTPSSIYEAFRRIGESHFDHIVRVVCNIMLQAVVLDEHSSLHISYPSAKVVPTILFTHKKKTPMIIRPRLNDLERNQFLNNL